MKLTREEFERSRNVPVLTLFEQGMRSKVTREKYTRTLQPHPTTTTPCIHG